MTGIGVATWCLDAASPPPWQDLAALGLDALHVDFGAPGAPSCFDRPAACRSHFTQTRACGLRTTAFALNVLERTGVGAPSAQALDLVARAVDAAARWLVPLVYLPQFGRARIDDDAGWWAATALLRAACERADGSDVLIATENVLPPRAARHLLRDVGHPRIRALIDVYNPVLHAHAAAEIMRATLPFMADQIHLKDGRDGALGNAALGHGDAGFDDSAAFLVAHQHRCTAILENDYAADGIARLRRDIATVRRHLGGILRGASPLLATADPG